MGTTQNLEEKADISLDRHNRIKNRSQKKREHSAAECLLSLAEPDLNTTHEDSTPLDLPQNEHYQFKEMSILKQIPFSIYLYCCILQIK